MERILIFIKHRLKILWTIIEWGNSFIFSIVYKRRMSAILVEVFREFDPSPYQCRKLRDTDAEQLYKMIQSQDPADLEYFQPHSFDLKSIQKQLKKISFLMMGLLNGEELIGYFFLRFFINRKCFVGRLIDKGHRGMGVGKIMNNIMYETAWKMNFRCLSTISKQNESIMCAHSKNRNIFVLKELQNDYLLVEFKR